MGAVAFDLGFDFIVSLLFFNTFSRLAATHLFHFYCWIERWGRFWEPLFFLNHSLGLRRLL